MQVFSQINNIKTTPYTNKKSQENDSVVAEMLHAQNAQNAIAEEKANTQQIIIQQTTNVNNNNNNTIENKEEVPEIPAIVEFKEVDDLQQTIIDKKFETDEQLIDISQKLQQLSTIISDESDCDLPSNTNKTFTGKVPKGRKRKKRKRRNKRGRKKQQKSDDEEEDVEEGNKDGNEEEIEEGEKQSKWKNNNREKDIQRDRERKRNRNRKTTYDASGGYVERERRMDDEENNSNTVFVCSVFLICINL